ncbi:3-keto-disaccharide hydrolase [Singulisphaera sp. PoT]|uniref:3-keto-disaccharide hydrolase n=1 Tax=Singulisphaera sp. PoT TaxID=3411797 RepID=UPI003BF473F1
MGTLKSTGLLLLALAAGAFAAESDFTLIFDGTSGKGWITNKDSKPLSKANVQADGLNPHKSGGYIVAHERPHGDFVFDFDYKLTKGCNSGVFIRVGELKEPVMTGLEIAIDDTTGTGLHDSGAFYDLVSPKVNAQKPAGEWNHMTITAKGPKIEVVLNGEAVSKIDLSEWTEPGKRPDGSKHKFAKVTVKDFARPGYLGFQDHGSDCWYKNVKIKDLD